MIRRGNLAMEPDEPEDDREPDSLESEIQQVEEARRELARPVSHYLAWPYPALADLMGGFAPGELCIATAFSGGGKTLFTTNVEHELLRQQRTVYHIGLETRPALVRLHFACLALDEAEADAAWRAGVPHRPRYYVGDVLSGAAKLRADWPEMEVALRAEVHAGFRPEYPLVVNRERWLDLPRLTRALEEAAFYGAQLVVIDHMDHLATPDHQSLYQASVQVTRRLVEMTQALQLRVLSLSQLNNDAVRGDVLAQHYPPRPEMVFMGGHKRQVATTMLGIFRPLSPDVTAEDLRDVRANKLERLKVVQPHVMGVGVMKHRHYGNREGKVIKLGVQNGRLFHVAQAGGHA